VICLPSHGVENQRLARQQQVTLFEVKGPPPDKTLGGWASFVTAALASGNTDYLAAELARPREGLTLQGLNRLGDQLAPGLRALQRSPSSEGKRTVVPDAPLTSANRNPGRTAEPAPVLETNDLWQRADGAHRRVPLVAAQVAAEAGSATSGEAGLQIDEEPARAIGQACPKAIDNLHLLEDTVFEAMAGKPAIMDDLTLLWSRVLSQVGPARADATREHYLRYALAVWRQLNEADGQTDPARGVQAMQVICLLFGE
jgi:hypothetical protein